MTTNIQSFQQSPIDWPEPKCSGLFHSKLWSDLICESFPAEVLFLKINMSFHLMTIFKAGPFHVGYLDFPVYNSLTEDSISDGLITALIKHKYPVSIDMIRIAVSAFSRFNVSIPAKDILPETEISDFLRSNLISSHNAIKTKIGFIFFNTIVYYGYIR